jgi:hypothetical protein
MMTVGGEGGLLRRAAPRNDERALNSSPNINLHTLIYSVFYRDFLLLNATSLGGRLLWSKNIKLLLSDYRKIRLLN